MPFVLSMDASKSQPAIMAAVGEKGLSCDVRRALGGEPDDQVRDLIGLSQAFYRGVRGPMLVDFFLRYAGCQCLGTRQFLQTLGYGVARANIVDQNSVFAEFVRQALHQTHHR